MGKDIVARLDRCMYGCRDSGSIWENTYTQALVDMGFIAGSASPCCVYHPQWDLHCVVHGDDFTCLGCDDSLNKYEAALKERFELKIKGRLGSTKEDDKDTRVLNRIVRIVEDGLLYEPDPRHVDLLLRDLGLKPGDKSSAAPGHKPKLRRRGSRIHREP